MRALIGENLKTLREKMGLNQRNIAEFLNVDQSLISKIEKGERNISADMLEKLSNLYGIQIDEIEREQVNMSDLSFAFRASDLSASDIEAISMINRIALNVEFMDKILEGEE